MKNSLRFIPTLLLPLILTNCAPSAEQEADYEAVRNSHVSPAIYDKMEHGDPLGVGDIASLGQARVNEAIIIRYIRDKETIYYLSPQDVDYLLKSGVSRSVVDYMVQTAPPPGSGYGYSGPAVGVGVEFGPFFHHWR